MKSSTPTTGITTCAWPTQLPGTLPTGPLTEKYGHWANFNYTKMNNTLGIPGALDFAGDGKTSFMTNRDWKEFSPHVGVAYQLTPRSVLRASYGIFYILLGRRPVQHSELPPGLSGSEAALDPSHNCEASEQHGRTFVS